MVQTEEMFKRFSSLVVTAAFFVMLGSIGVVNAAEEWVELPVIVNIVDSADDTNIDDALDKANEILKQAKIKLVVKKTNKNVNVGDNDADLTEEEGSKAQEDGQKELDNTFKGKDGKWDGKGIKITVGDDCWVEEPNTIGWSVHRNPVVVVEGGAEPNSLGGTIAHELIHALTVEDHSDDPNNVMYPTDEGGTLIDPNDVKEIFPEAKKRGSAFTIKLEKASSETVAPAKIEYSVDAYGAILDDFRDLTINPPIYDPKDPTIQYADVREVTLFADTPFVPGGLARFEIHRGGLIPPWQVNSFFDVFFDIDSIFPGPDFQMHIQLLNLAGEATITDLATPSNPVISLPVIVHRNDKFDGSMPLPNNHSLEVQIPIEILSLSLTSDQPITVAFGSAMTMDFRPDCPITQFAEQVAPFTVRLSNCPSPRVHVQNVDGLYVIKGHDFDSNDVLNYYIDGVLAGTTQSDDLGDVLAAIPPAPCNQPGVALVTLRSVNDTAPSGAKTATAALSYCPQGHTDADLDNDCDVDLLDFAEFAANWLQGT